MRSLPPHKPSSGDDRRSSWPARGVPLYHLILHARPDRALMTVVDAVMELTRFGRDEAVYRMWVSHRTGSAAVMTAHFERAEFYAERFTSRGLDVTLEPA